jgi:plastocyanin
MSRRTTSARGPVVAGALLLAGLSLTACASKTSVGKGLGEAKATAVGGNLFDSPLPSPSGSAATGFARASLAPSTRAAAATTTAAPVRTKAAPVVTRTTAAAVSTTTAAAATTSRATSVYKPFDIGIWPDGDPTHSAFDPVNAAVFVGTKVIFTNHDSVARSVIAQHGEFSSPPIPPGGAYTYEATTPGQISFQDGTRPYVDGQLQVEAR